MEDHFQPVLPALQRAPRALRRDGLRACRRPRSCADPHRPLQHGRTAERADGAAEAAARQQEEQPATAGGADQMKMLRRMPQILRFIPGTAQDVRAYFLTLQYWLAGSEDNIVNMVRFLVEPLRRRPARRLARRPPRPLRRRIPGSRRLSSAHAGPLSASASRTLPLAPGPSGTVGVLMLRSYLLAGNAAHYDGVIAALEARGLRVIPAFASGLDRAPGDRALLHAGRRAGDRRAGLADRLLAGRRARLQRLARRPRTCWRSSTCPMSPRIRSSSRRWSNGARSERGLLPVESTIMVAIPELDGATGPMVFGGRPGRRRRDLHRLRARLHLHRVDIRPRHAFLPGARRHAGRARREAGRAAPRRARRAQGRRSCCSTSRPTPATPARPPTCRCSSRCIDTLAAMKARGLSASTLPDTRRRTARRDHRRQRRPVRRARQRPRAHCRPTIMCAARRYLKRDRSAVGPRARASSRATARRILVLGERFGNVFVGVQPAFGYEGDPMRLLFEKGFAPTHAFSAFYRFLREDFGAACGAAFRHPRRAGIHARQADPACRAPAGPTG